MNETSETPEAEVPVEPSYDGYLAGAILVGALIAAVVGIYMWKKNKRSGDDRGWQQNSFSPPPERAEYIEAKSKADMTDIQQMDDLKKLLMKRTMKTIPILLSLQSEGSSIERLYKKGMLTDDMHFKVKALKSFVDKEFQDIQMEADELVEGWGPGIWQQAMQFHQMIQKQKQAKTDEQKQAEDQKKKADVQRRKDKEKAKKLANSVDKEQTKSVEVKEEEVILEPVIEPVDPETAKAQAAERMAQQLIDEEEQRVGKGKKGAKSNKKV